MKTDTESRDQLWSMIKDIKFGMFTTRHTNGHLHARPMTTQNSSLDEDESLWFFMSRRSDPVADLQGGCEVNVSYADTGADKYVSVSGMGSVVTDPAKVRALWTKMAQAWFPGGVDDPDLALVEVKISHANYWDVKDSKITQLFKMAKAAVTGEPPSNMAETGEVRMRSGQEGST